MAVETVEAEMMQTKFDAVLDDGGYIELNLACANVPKLDLTSKSDPFAVVYSKDGDTWGKLGTTETIYDTHSCRWTQKFAFSRNATDVLRIDVYDRDSQREDLIDHDYIGTTGTVKLSEIVEHPQKCVERSLLRKDLDRTFGSANLGVDAVFLPENNFRLHFSISVDFRERSKYYYVLEKKIPGAGFHPVYRSDLLGRKQSSFAPVSLRLSQLCAGDENRLVKLTMYQFHALGKSKHAGFCELTVDMLANLGKSKQLTWVHSASMRPGVVFVQHSQDRLSKDRSCELAIVTEPESLAA